MRCESLDGWRRSGKSPFLCLYFAVRRVAPEHMYFCVISVGIFNSRGNINLIILTLVIHEPGFLNKDDEIVPARRWKFNYFLCRAGRKKGADASRKKTIFPEKMSTSVKTLMGMLAQHLVGGGKEQFWHLARPNGNISRGRASTCAQVARGVTRKKNCVNCFSLYHLFQLWHFGHDGKLTWEAGRKLEENEKQRNISALKHQGKSEIEPWEETFYGYGKGNLSHLFNEHIALIILNER